MTDWRDRAALLWGPQWPQSLATVAGVSLRSVQRWAAADDPPAAVKDWLYDTCRLVPDDLQRIYGATIRASMLGGAELAGRALEFALADVDGGRLP